MARQKRYTGASRAIAYSADADVACPIGTGATYFNNAYNVSVDFDIGEIDTTAFGDYPFGTAEPGFIKGSISLSLRKQEGAADCNFIESKALSREAFRIAILDERGDATARFDCAVIATKITDSGDYSSAQDLSYTLSLAPSDLKPIVNGVNYGA